MSTIGWVLGGFTVARDLHLAKTSKSLFARDMQNHVISVKGGNKNLAAIILLLAAFFFFLCIGLRNIRFLAVG